MEKPGFVNFFSISKNNDNLLLDFYKFVLSLHIRKINHSVLFLIIYTNKKLWH